MPLEVVTPLLADQLAGNARLLFCCKFQPDTFCQYTVTVVPEWLMFSVGAPRRAEGLHHGNETPKSTGQGIIPAGHRATGVRLADGAGHLIGRTRAGAAAAGDFIPVN